MIDYARADYDALIDERSTMPDAEDAARLLRADYSRVSTRV